MKVLVVYDSLFGNTAIVAKAIGRAFPPGEAFLIRAAEAGAADLHNVDLLIVGSPTHGGRASKTTQEFFGKLPPDALNGIYAAAFDTGIPAQGQGFFLRWLINTIGYASKHLRALLKKQGAAVLAAETFFVQGKEGPLQLGEADRATAWASLLPPQMKDG